MESLYKLEDNNVDNKTTDWIKTTVNPTNTLVTYNENSADKTTQNSDNVINKIIQINDKEPFKNKNKKMQTKI